MKYIKLLSFFLVAASLISCGDDDSEGTSPSELGSLEGTVWELSILSTTPGNGCVDELWYQDGFIAYADHIGLPYEKLSNEIKTYKDTVSLESVETYTLTFSKNSCTWAIDKATTCKINESCFEYERYKFTPQDFILPCRFICEDEAAMDTIRVTNDAVQYLYYKQFDDTYWFKVPLTNGVYSYLIDSSSKELPDGHLAESQQTTFDNLRVEPTSFIMQKGDEIYSAQYDVTAGWLILNMLSPRHEEIGKFEIKKIK